MIPYLTRQQCVIQPFGHAYARPPSHSSLLLGVVIGLNRLVQIGAFTRSHSAPALSLPRLLIGLAGALLRLGRHDPFLVLARQLAASVDALVTNWQVFDCHPILKLMTLPVVPGRLRSWQAVRQLSGHSRWLG